MLKKSLPTQFQYPNRLRSVIWMVPIIKLLRISVRIESDVISPKEPTVIIYKFKNKQLSINFIVQDFFLCNSEKLKTTKNFICSSNPNAPKLWLQNSNCIEFDFYYIVKFLAWHRHQKIHIARNWLKFHPLISCSWLLISISWVYS